ncbi:AI-2E family transporter [Nocardia sp. BMG111209]|uniref:AI-2E family transporter n=1 Tax=Nocardia sp. BMG111209 TaxID=1160137 RepID=UPI000363D523|nr:AI-2E family transporter [Nocardia sp. BMG111209]
MNAPAPGLVLRWAAAATVGVLLVLVAAYGIYRVRSLLVLVLVSLFLAVGLDPIVRWLTGRGLPRWLAVLIVVLVALALVAVFVWSIVPPLVDQGSRLVGDLPGYLERVSSRSSPARRVADRYHLTERLADLASQLPGKLSGGAIGFMREFVGLLASTVTVIALTIYFMADMPRLRHGITRLFPPPRRPRAEEVVDVVTEKVGGYMLGNITVSLIAGALTFVCLRLVGTSFALPLAVTVAVTDLIPLIGATLGAIACLIVTVFSADLWPAAVIVLLFFLVYQAFETYVLVPRVLHNAVDLSSVTVLLVALTGGALLGLIGALMAIPIAAAIKVLLSPRMANLYDEPDDQPADEPATP